MRSPGRNRPRCRPARPQRIGRLGAEQCEVGGQVISGGRVSTTVMSCRQFVVFPHWSMAVHVRRMKNSSGHSPGRTTSLQAMTRWYRSRRPWRWPTPCGAGRSVRCIRRSRPPGTRSAVADCPPPEYAACTYWCGSNHPRGPGADNEHFLRAAPGDDLIGVVFLEDRIAIIARRRPAGVLGINRFMQAIVKSGGQAMSGGRRSLTVKRWTQLTLLLQASQMRWTRSYQPSHTVPLSGLQTHS